jgi:streptogramin lyase
LFAAAELSYGQAATVGMVLHPLNPHDTDNATNVPTFADGARLVTANGGVYFLEANADRIAFFKNDVITEWPVRSRSYASPYRHIGASPADFELDPDGHTIWFFENGASGIDALQSVFAKLDTETNVMTEWILSISRPAGFYRDPDGVTVWIAMSQGTLVRLNLSSLQVDDFRSPHSVAYSGLLLGPDGALYLSDFGSNRIVRFDRATLGETAWQTFDPTKVQERMSQPIFDVAGNIYFAEDISGGAIGRLNLSSGTFDRLAAGYLDSPTHFFLQGNFVYVTETDPLGGDGRVVIVDGDTAPKTNSTLTPVTATFITVPGTSATMRTFTLTPITFQSSDSPPDAAVSAVSPAIGVSRFPVPHGSKFPSTTSYSITLLDGKPLCGIRGALAEFILLPAANPTDFIVPLALNDPTGIVRTDFLFHAPTTAATTVTALFYDSPVPPAPQVSYTLPADQTLFVANGLGSNGLILGQVSGSLRFAPFVGTAASFSGLCRTSSRRADGGTFGFQLPDVPVSQGLTTGSASALFFAPEDSETTIFGIYSPTGAVGSAVLSGPDGTVRGNVPFFLPANNRVEFNPAFQAFNVPAEAGDFVTFSIDSGTIFPYAVFYEASGDAAVGTPVVTSSDFVFPLIGSGEGANGANFVSTVLFANPDPQNAATINTALYPLDPASEIDLSTVTVPPGGSARLDFGPANPGIGSLLVRSSLPVWAAARVANQTNLGDYAGFAAPLLGAGQPKFLVSGDSSLRVNLIVYNRGGEGQLTITGFNASGGTTATLTVPVRSHSPFLLPEARHALHIPGQGRIEVSGTTGTSLYGWLSSADRITGDPDVEPPIVP